MFKVKIDTKEVEKLLNGMKKELLKYQGVRTGYITAKDYEDKKGFDTVKNALLQEFGGIIKVPAHTSTVYRSFNEKKGSFNDNGRFVKEKKANWSETVNIPAYIIKIPSRPFIRNAIAKNEQRWIKDFEKLLTSEKPLKQLLMEMGIKIKVDLQNSIDNNTPPPNAPATIRKKKSSKTLIDTGNLKKSIQNELIKNK
jgi:hypothetical protein